MSEQLAPPLDVNLDIHQKGKGLVEGLLAVSVFEEQTRGVKDREGLDEDGNVGRLGLGREGGGWVVSLVSDVLKS